MHHSRLIYPVILLLAIVATSCHTSKRSHEGITGGRNNFPATIHVGKGDAVHQLIAEEAYSWLGTPYAYAKSEKGKGTDCSGMVMKVYENVGGWKLPRNSAKQAEFCDTPDSDEIEVGDLVFFATGKDIETISHVGIMLDEENFIHASTSKGVVISKINTPYYIRTFKKFGRIPANTPSDTKK